jgi:hypothetical protein
MRVGKDMVWYLVRRSYPMDGWKDRLFCYMSPYKHIIHGMTSWNTQGGLGTFQ